MKEDKITTLEITDTHIKLFQSDQAQRGKNITYRHIRKIAGLSDQEISERLTRIFKDKKIDPNQLIFIIPRRYGTLLYLDVPSHHPDEIQKIIGHQIVNKVPYTREDVVHEYLILEKNSSGYSKVLVVVVPKETIDRYLHILTQASIHPKIVTLSSIGLKYWYSNQHRPENEKNLSVELLVSIDFSHSELCFLEKDKLLFSREINFGSQDIKGDPLSIEYYSSSEGINEASRKLGGGVERSGNMDGLPGFLNQINLTIKSYYKERMGNDIAGILILANSPAATGLVDRIKNDYQIPIAIVNPEHGFGAKKNDPVPEELMDDSIAIAANLGLLTAPLNQLLNLLPSEVTANRQSTQRKQQWITLGSYSAVICLLLFLIGGLQWFKNKDYVEQLKNKIKDVKPQVSLAEEKIRRFEFIQEKLKNRILMDDFIYEIHKIIPEGITLNVFDYDPKGVLTLEGVSQEGVSVNSFQNNMVNSPLFKEITLDYATKRKTITGEFTYFRIICQVKNPSTGPSKTHGEVKKAGQLEELDKTIFN